MKVHHRQPDYLFDCYVNLLIAIYRLAADDAKAGSLEAHQFLSETLEGKGEPYGKQNRGRLFVAGRSEAVASKCSKPRNPQNR